jgi:hypothetical protein
MKHPTSNIEHPTSSGEPMMHGPDYWMFDVGCWLLDVSRFCKSMTIDPGQSDSMEPFSS